MASQQSSEVKVADMLQGPRPTDRHHFASQDGHFTAAVPQGFCDIQRAESLKSVDE